MVVKPEIKEPKDLGVKIGTPEEAFWTSVRDKCKNVIEQAGYEIIIQKHILGLAGQKILLGKKK